jgi:hypothetical protein
LASSAPRRDRTHHKPAREVKPPSRSRIPARAHPGHPVSPRVGQKATVADPNDYRTSVGSDAWCSSKPASARRRIPHPRAKMADVPGRLAALGVIVPPASGLGVIGLPGVTTKPATGLQPNAKRGKDSLPGRHLERDLRIAGITGQGRAAPQRWPRRRVRRLMRTGQSDRPSRVAGADS